MASSAMEQESEAAVNPQMGDWHLWCRLCAKEDAQNISVFCKDEQQSSGESTTGEPSLAAAIGKYFWVYITRDEDLPKVLCAECLSLVTSLVNFSERVSKVQQLYCHLQSTPVNSREDLQALRLRYGLLDEDRVPVPLPEVHYFEAKPKVTQLNAPEADPELEGVFSGTLDHQPRLNIKIEKENIQEERLQDEVACDFEQEEEYEEDPFDGNDDREFLGQTESSNELSELVERKPRKAKETKRKRRKLLKSESPSHDHSDVETNSENDVKKSSKHASKPSKTYFYNCIECGQKYQRPQHYRAHMRRIHGKVVKEPVQQCLECGRLCRSPMALERHRQTHLPVELRKMLPCPYCDKKFFWKSLVETHIKGVHMNERPFICEECGEAVRTNGALKAHMLTHTDYAPFECDICHKCFKNQVRLRNHMETHDPNKHVCAECGLQLNSRATLNRHLLVHSDEMQHKCDYCGRAFKRAKALKNHLILHTGLKPYSCDFCDRTFANGSNCRSHKKKAHPEELAALEAAGGGKTYTRNIPKLEALKAVTKAADNLTPVVSKQSGCFSFGRKPKPPTKEPQSKKHKGEKDAKPTVNNALLNSGSGGRIPTIDNIYSHIMKQANIPPPEASVNIQIKRPPSESSASTGPPIIIEIDTTQQMQQQHLPPVTPSHPSQPPTPTGNSNSGPPPSSFYMQIIKQQHEQQQQQQQQPLSLMQQQQHNQVLMQQQREDIRSPDSQASHMTDEHSNNAPQSAPFYSHVAQNVQGQFI